MTNSATAFNAAASRYDADAHANLMMRWLRRESLRHLTRNFKAGDTVLEIGCGTGEEAIALARRGVRVLATDASAGVIKVVNDKLHEDEALSSRITARGLGADPLKVL